MQQKPSVGCVVHYTDAQVGSRAAIITRIPDQAGSAGLVNLNVFYDVDDPAELRAGSALALVPYADEDTPGTWTWPPRI